MAAKVKKVSALRVPKIEIFPENLADGTNAATRQYFFRVRATNGEIIAASEGYTRKLDARKAADRLKATVTAAKIVEVES